MRAPSNDAAGIEHDDTARMANGVHPLGHDQDGAVLGLPGEGGAQIASVRKSSGKAVVEDEISGVTDDRAGDRKPLALSARNIPSAL